MDVREKLVELLKTNACPSPFMCDQACKYYGYGDCFPDRFADHLIASGVTVQEWISADERLPEHGDVVLCFMKFGEQRILQWDNVSRWWLGYGHGDDWQKADVANWMPLPQPPKGE